MNRLLNALPGCLLFSFFLLLLTPARSQDIISIRGIVSDEKGAPLPGVTVELLANRKLVHGTSTDEKGVFVFRKLPEATYALRFSHLGYANKSIDKYVYHKGNFTTLTVEMTPAATSLNDMVVMGYGAVRRRDVTGAVSKADMGELNKAPVRSFVEALQGRLAGVAVSSVDGQPGSMVNIVIRGNNSISQDNSPLFVIDGFPVENPDNNMLNPADIESLTVLKDASATAIYGARGANGVIVITTIKGKEGPPSLVLNTSYGLQKNIKEMKLMSPYDFVKYQLERDPSTGDGSPDSLYLSGGHTLDYYRNVKAIDWQSLMFRQATMQNHSISLTGGTAATKYAFSGSVFGQDGTIISSDYSRYQGRLALDQTISSRLKVGINTNYSYLVQRGISPSFNSVNVATGLLYSMYGSRPVNSSLDTTSVADDLFDPQIDLSTDYRINPVINQQNLVRNNKSKILNVNAYAEYTVLPGLHLRVSGGYNDNSSVNEQFNNSKTLYGSTMTTWGAAYAVNGTLTFSDQNSWVNENTLNWNLRKGKHSLNVLAGLTEQSNHSSAYGFGSSNLPNESLGFSGLDEGKPLVPSTKATSSLWTMTSLLGRVNYEFASRYLLTATWRADASSKFAPQNRWGYFPSGALAWRFSEERFVRDAHIFSDGKLRASYGLTGNNRVSDFGYLATYSSGQSFYVFNNTFQPAIIPLTLANPNLKWEVTSQLDLGFDLGFFNNRLTTTVDLYRKKTYDLLLNATLPYSTGYTTAYKNIGSVRNQGLEFTVQGTPVQTSRFTWNSSFNIAFNQNKVLSLTEGQQSITSAVAWDNSWATLPAYISKIGQPLGNMYGYIWDGVYQAKDFNQATDGTYVLKDNVATNGNTRGSIRPGDIKYRDLNGDGVVNASDYTVIGRGLPIYTGGFNNSFTYKGFDLNVFFQWSYGNNAYNTNRLVFEGNSFNKPYLNQFATYNDRWEPDHTNTSLYRVGGFFGGGYSSRTVEDASYLRLKTVALGYTLPASLMRRAKINRVRIYASAQNLVTWTRYKGPDPEVNTYNSVLTPGFDFSSYPRSRTILFGANLNF